MNTTELIKPVIEYCRVGYGMDCLDVCLESVTNPATFLGLMICLLLLVIWRQNGRIERKLAKDSRTDEIERIVKKLNEKIEGLEKEKEMSTKETQTPCNAERDQNRINIFDPRYSTGNTINKNQNRRRSGIPRSTTFPRSAESATVDDEDFQSEFNIPIPLAANNNYP